MSSELPSVALLTFFQDEYSLQVEKEVGYHASNEDEVSKFRFFFFYNVSIEYSTAHAQHIRK
jgi:hypothetical protein